MKKENLISEIDQCHYRLIRDHIAKFLEHGAAKYGDSGLLLDVAPQNHEGAGPFFPEAEIHTLDIDPASGATYIADICADNSALIPTGRFDKLVCTEVLEHTLNPFDAAREIRRLLRPGGLAFISVPFNFRIHGPLPDCWRFTEHGLRAILADFFILELNELATEGRDLMPVHYTVVARNDA